ncbi:alpha/beta hydrolase [Lewinella cohaerens]|uniref:alpha/beta hydrolase n=1 Tax=Lewinella cohaerens TaxID=70995 RepID=UPI00035DC04D|nr:alpha/beta hydrolase-fold protein [Lewinella cohaerens]
MKKVLWLACLSFCILRLNAQEKALPEITQRDAFSIGETFTFLSKNLSEERRVNIYLPNGYDDNSTKEYPVIYLLDGAADEDFIHIAGLVQFGTFPWINMLPESIVIGIANVDRKRDFTYPTNNTQDKADFPTTGGSAAFIDFLEQELQPLIQDTYRTVDTTTIIGQSLGGLLATEILFKKPTLFDNYLIISPSLWWDDESLLDYSPNLSSVTGKIYVAVGKEGPTMKRVARSLAKKLSAAKLDVHFDYFGKQDHGNILHQAVYRAFSVLYPKEEK